MRSAGKVDIVGADPLSVMRVATHMRDSDREEIFATRWTDSPIDLAEDTMAVPGPKWVAHLEGVGPVAVYGMAPLWPGVWSLWLYGTPHFRRVGWNVSRHIRRDMFPALAIVGAHRAEARSIATHTEAHAWMVGLGGRQEATLSGYGKAGEDFIVFSWDVRVADVRVRESGRRRS